MRIVRRFLLLHLRRDLGHSLLYAATLVMERALSHVFSNVNTGGGRGGGVETLHLRSSSSMASHACAPSTQRSPCAATAAAVSVRTTTAAEEFRQRGNVTWRRLTTASP
eukprot:6190168-Pleurochrysis_carterae.AAC.2